MGTAATSSVSPLMLQQSIGTVIHAKYNGETQQDAGDFYTRLAERLKLEELNGRESKCTDPTVVEKFLEGTTTWNVRDYPY